MQSASEQPVQRVLEQPVQYVTRNEFDDLWTSLGPALRMALQDEGVLKEAHLDSLVSQHLEQLSGELQDHMAELHDESHRQMEEMTERMDKLERAGTKQGQKGRLITVGE